MVLVDDSIVRGTTSKKIVHIIRAAGAWEIHVRITSPPIIGPCYYGIDTPTKRELIASSKSVEEIRKFIGADSLGYLSLEAMMAAVGDEERYCSACFTDQLSDGCGSRRETEGALREKPRADAIVLRDPNDNALHFRTRPGLKFQARVPAVGTSIGILIQRMETRITISKMTYAGAGVDIDAAAEAKKRIRDPGSRDIYTRSPDRYRQLRRLVPAG